MDHRTAPNFRPPQIIDSPEVDVSLHNKAYVTDGILFRSFKTILPIDPQELNPSSRSISFYINDKVGLVNPHQYVPLLLFFHLTCFFHCFYTPPKKKNLTIIFFSFRIYLALKVQCQHENGDAIKEEDNITVSCPLISHSLIDDVSVSFLQLSIVQPFHNIHLLMFLHFFCSGYDLRKHIRSAVPIPWANILHTDAFRNYSTTKKVVLKLF